MPSFLVSLTRSQNELAHRVNDHIVELGLSVDEFLVIQLALEDRARTAAAIGRRIGLRQSTFTSMVARLVERGYLRTKPCPRDRRTRYLVPTLPGLTATRIARSIHSDLEALATPREVLDAYRTLERLGLLISLLPEPERMDDGLPLITA
jgi:DNA-binding MarR family transcriptional regulator